MNRPLFYLYKILSYSFFLTISDDSKFGEITKNFRHENIRFSLFSFKIGIRSFYFFTFKSSENFKYMEVLNLYSIQNYEEKKQKSGDLYEEYKNKLSKKNHENIMCEKEFINYKISEVVNIKNKTFNKFLAYVAILAFIMPLYIPKALEVGPYLKTYKSIFLFLLIYIFFNIISLSYAFIRVHEVQRTTFKNISESDSPKRELNALLLYEWKNITNESIFEVALIKNLEKYIGAIILWSILIIGSTNVELTVNTDKNNVKKIEVLNEQSEVITLQSEISFNKFLKENSLKINEIKDGILNNKYKMIIFISKDNNLNTNLSNLFGMYNDGSIEMITIHKNSDVNQVELLLIYEE